MKNAAVFVVPGNIDARTGGYIYDRRIGDGLRARGWSIDVQSLDDTFPRPTPSAIAHATDVFAALTAGTVVVVDSLALGAIPEILEQHRSRLRIVALMHLPLAADIGIDELTAAQFATAERRALGAATLVIVTGRATLPLIAGYDVPAVRVVVVEPGTDPAPLARGSGTSRVELLSVGTLNPGKGYEELLNALKGVGSRDWHLTCAGSLTRHPPTVARIRALVRERELDEHVSLVGELDAEQVEEHYARADVFVLATFRETYGMAVAEALAHGLPVVSTSTGAIPTLVGTDAGLLVPPGDVQALSAALSRVIGDAHLRSRLAEGARRVRPCLVSWEQAVDTFASALESMTRG
jgi:glycosyltransferase involved in cell wall biosynthesis